MEFCAKFFKRVPIREVAPTLVTVLALAGIFGDGASMFGRILDILGSYWG